MTVQRCTWLGKGVKMGSDRGELLRLVWARWMESLDGLDEAAWSAPTRCGDWDVRALVAHVSDGIIGFHTSLRDRMVEREAGIISAAQLMGLLKPDSRSAQATAEKADARARRSSERDLAQLREPFNAFADEVLQIARAHPVGVVDYFGRADVAVEGLIELALLEATVHYLDLAEALGDRTDLSSEVMRNVLETLLSMSTPQALIEVATGRRRADDIFPVHS